MKSHVLLSRSFFLALTLMISMFTTSSAFAFSTVANIASIFPSPIEKIFVPNIFDENDNSQVILQGTYSYSCFHEGQSGFSLDQELQVIKVWATSYEQTGANAHPAAENCQESQRSFIQVVDLGPLAAGEYTVQYEDEASGLTLTSPLIITAAQSDNEPENQLYAPIDFVALEVSADPSALDLNSKSDKSASILAGSTTLLTLVGTYPYLYIGCMQLKQVELEQSQKDIVIIHPMAEINEQDCPRNHANYKFEYSTYLPKNLSSKTLIHVRLPDGNSINKLLEI